MIEQLIADHLAAIGHTWTVIAPDGAKLAVTPTEEDVEIVLDEAAKQLYNEEVGSRIDVGGLIIEKQTVGYAVYAYFGEYI